MNDDLFDRDGSVKSEVRHGEAVLRCAAVSPMKRQVVLPNGEVTDAICLAAHGDEQVWARKIETNNHLHRRGRLIVEPHVALRFVDEADADISVNNLMVRPSLERDLLISRRIQDRITSKVFALLLYLTLHGVAWRHDETGEVWSCSSRGAGEIVDRLCGDAGFTMWYLLRYEQTLRSNYLDEAVVAEIASLGWTPIFLEAGASE